MFYLTQITFLKLSRGAKVKFILIKAKKYKWEGGSRLSRIPIRK